jgi:hypothetical protein
VILRVDVGSVFCYLVFHVHELWRNLGVFPQWENIPSLLSGYS